MEKKTKILIGLAAAAGVVAYLILKPKKALASTSVSQELNKMVADLQLGLVRCGDGTMQKKEDCATRGGYNTGVVAPLTDKTPLTKDCVQMGYDCTNWFEYTMQIPLDEDCNNVKYQPAMPNCAPPPGGGGEEHLIPIDFWQSELNY